MTEIFIKNVEGITNSGDQRLLYEPYNFEHKALKEFFGLYWKDRNRRKEIILAYVKIRPTEKINKIIKIAEEKGYIPEETIILVLKKWLDVNEYFMGLKFKAIDGRKGEEEQDIKEGIDTRNIVEYAPGYVDPWMDEQRMKL